jgi:RNA polymerase sigma-70 factor (ECF subfamily)
VARALRGERDGFESLVLRHTRLAGAVAYGVLGDRHLSEDAVQEAFLKAFRSLDTLREAGRFRSWFAEIVRRVALDLRRSRGAKSRPAPQDPGDLELRSDLVPRSDDSPERTEVRAETRAAVLAAIEELGEDDRTVVVLKHLEGLSYKEIAELTSSTVNAVESRLFRARQTLRRKLRTLEA